MKNKETIKQIFEEHFASVYRLNLLRTNSKHEAEDLTAESFLRLSKLAEIDPKTAKAWLLKVSHNIMVDKYRKESKTYNLDSQTEQSIEDIDSGLVEEELIKADDVNLVQNAIKQLDQIDKEIVTLKIWEEYTFDQISEVMKLPVNTVKTKFYRALEQMRHLIEPTVQAQAKRKYMLAYPYILTALGKAATAREFEAAAAVRAGILNNLLDLRIMQTGVIVSGISTKTAAVVVGAILAITALSVSTLMVLDPWGDDAESTQAVESGPVNDNSSDDEEKETAKNSEAEIDSPKKTVSFTMSSRGEFETDNIFSAELYESEAVVVQDEDDDGVLHSAVDEVVIKGDGFEFEISYVWESEVTYKYIDYKNISETKFANELYRVRREASSQNWLYVNEISLDKSCSLFGEVTQAPCSRPVIVTRLLGDLVIECRATNNAVTNRCDEIVKSLSADQVPTE